MVVLTGQRRVGKSYVLLDLKKELSAVRLCNSPAGGVRATATSSGHRVRRCGHFGLTCRRTPSHNALCGTSTPQVIFTKPEPFAPPVIGGLYVP